MTFKDLYKRVSNLETTKQEHKTLERLRDKPFWIWDTEQHKQEDINTKGECCFSHIIGLPTKERTEKPMFDYEKLLYDLLFDIEYYNTLKHAIRFVSTYGTHKENIDDKESKEQSDYAGNNVNEKYCPDGEVKQEDGSGVIITNTHNQLF